MLVMSKWLSQTANIQYYIVFFHMHLCPGHFEKGFSTNGLRNTTFLYPTKSSRSSLVLRRNNDALLKNVFPKATSILCDGGNFHKWLMSATVIVSETTWSYQLMHEYHRKKVCEKRSVHVQKLNRYLGSRSRDLTSLNYNTITSVHTNTCN